MKIPGKYQSDFESSDFTNRRYRFIFDVQVLNLNIYLYKYQRYRAKNIIFEVLFKYFELTVVFV